MTARLPAWRIVLLFLLGLSAATALARQQPIFQSGVRLVQASVIVHDKNGQPVTDLAAGDFKLFEDGKEQPIELFVVEKAAGRDNLEGGGKPLGNPAGGGNPLGLPTASSPGVFTNQFDARVGGGVTVILFDRLNSSFEDQTRARDQIINYLARIQPTDHVAELLRVLQLCTAHRAQLRCQQPAVVCGVGHPSLASLRVPFPPSQHVTASPAPSSSAVPPSVPAIALPPAP